MTIHHMWMVQQLLVDEPASVRSTTTRKKCSSKVVAFWRLTIPSMFVWLRRSVVSKREPVINCSWNMWISSMFRQSYHTTHGSIVKINYPHHIWQYILPSLHIYMPSPQKESQMFFFAITVKKLFTNFHQIWQVAAAINAEQYVLKLSTSPGVCKHTTL